MIVEWILVLSFTAGNYGRTLAAVAVVTPPFTTQAECMYNAKVWMIANKADDSYGPKPITVCMSRTKEEPTPLIRQK